MAGSLKEVRERIRSVQNTQQITKAMKMVAAAKLRKAQQAIQQMRPYSEKLEQMLTNILSNLDGDSSTTFGTEREVQRAAIVVITSNRGLAGAFNSNVIKSAVNTINTKYADVLAKGNLTLIPVGKKGFDYFRKRYGKEMTIVSDYVSLFEDLSFDNVKKVSQRLMDGFQAGEFDAIEVSYGRFRNAAVQYAETERFLPVAKLEKDENAKATKADYIFEPDKEKLLNELVPSILQTQFQKYILDTHASEHGARMTAMGNATENAEELLKNLRVSYNKARQEAITKELSEIVGGAAALEGA